MSTVAALKALKRRADLRKEKYFLNPKKCENSECGNFLSYDQNRDGRKTCSRSCARLIPRIVSLETRYKLSLAKKSKKQPDLIKTCEMCELEFKISFRKRAQKCCSSKCSRSLSAKKSVETRRRNDTFPGWPTRTSEPSYPEKYFISVFNNEGITGWEREKKVGKWFIDFAFESKMLAVEIDGQQHEEPERKASDERKDTFLKEQGWEVIRIPWSNPRSKTSMLSSFIEKLLVRINAG